VISGVTRLRFGRILRAASLSSALLLASCSSDAPSTGPPSASLAPQVVTVGRHDIRSVVVLDGTITRDPTLAIKAPVSGEVTEILVSSGASVTPNQALVIVQSMARGPSRLAAPAAGVIANVDVVPSESVAAGDDLLDLAPDAYQAVATVDPSLLYRFYGGPPLAVLVEIDKGPAPFACPFVSLGLPLQSAGGPQAQTQPVEFVCSVPSGEEVFSGVPCVIGVTTAAANNAIAIPVTAVEGSAQVGYVTIVGKDGTESRTEVQLGISDGTYVQVLTGLAAGDRILDIPPDLISPAT
jgi:multidrug efflux pump subunit AcrA (membrane-fusion protein)